MQGDIFLCVQSEQHSHLVDLSCTIVTIAHYLDLSLHNRYYRSLFRSVVHNRYYRSLVRSVSSFRHRSITKWYSVFWLANKTLTLVRLPSVVSVLMPYDR
mgnify:CR=1 FL=1